MGVPGQVLDVLERHVLGKQIRDHQDAKRVGRKDLRQPGGLQPPLEHQLYGQWRHRPFGERTGAPLTGAKERRGLGRIRQAAPLEVGRDPLVQVVAHRDLPGLPSFFRKLQRPVVAVIAQVPDLQAADGPDPGAGVDERSQDRPVPEPVHVIRLDGGEGDGAPARPSPPAFGPRRTGGRTPGDRMKRIEQGGVSGDQDVEKNA